MVTEKETFILDFYPPKFPKKVFWGHYRIMILSMSSKDQRVTPVQIIAVAFINSLPPERTHVVGTHVHLSVRRC